VPSRARHLSVLAPVLVGGHPCVHDVRQTAFEGAHGDFTGSNVAAATDQTITLSGVNLATSMGLSASATDAQIITELLNRGKLVTDGQ